MSSVLHLSVTKRGAPQGVAKVVDNFSDFFQIHGHRVIRNESVYTNSSELTGKKTMPCYFSLIRSKFTSLRYLYILKFILVARSLVKKNQTIISNYEVIVCHDVFTFFVLSKSKLKIGCRVFLFNHSDGHPIDTLAIGVNNLLDRIIYSYIEKEVLNSPIDTVCSLSDTSSDGFLNRHYGNVSRYVTLKNFAPSKKSHSSVRRSPKVWIIGTVCERKRQVDLSNRLSDLESPFKFNILGQCDSFSLQTFKASKVVNIVQCVNDIMEIIIPGDIVLSVSDNEGLPMALIEAASIGCVLIATDVGGCHEIVKNNINGYLIEKNFDVSELNKLVNKVLNDKYLRDKFSKNSLTLYQDCFSVSALSQVWQKIINE